MILTGLLDKQVMLSVLLTELGIFQENDLMSLEGEGRTEEGGEERRGEEISKI